MSNFLKIITALITLTFFMGGSVQAASSGLSEVDKIVLGKMAVERTIKDTSSIRWSNVSVNSSGALCGQFNAKNSYGAYAGKQQFSVTFDARGAMQHLDLASALKYCD